jgi:FixJ family two-component response regulator
MVGPLDKAPTRPLIFIVDDDCPVRTALGNLLRSAGYATAAFESAEELLASGRTGEIDCAVLDVKLGGMNGYELHQRLLALRPALPVVFVSGHGDDAMERRALLAGAIAFLRKPIDADALLACIHDALGGEGSGA